MWFWATTHKPAQRTGVRFGAGANTLTNALDGATATWTAASDERLKKNIDTYAVGLDFLCKLRPVTFEWREKGEVPQELTCSYREGSTDAVRGKSGVRYHGFIAQEVKAMIDSTPGIPNGQGIWTNEEATDGTQGLSQDFGPIYVNAFHEIAARLSVLEGKV